LYCNPNPCTNNGICEEGISGPICKCRGFTGTYCNIDINECANNNPCHNGGKCINTFGSFKCDCPTNVTGTYCDIQPPTSTIPWILYIMIGTGILLLLIIICTITVCWGQSKRRKQQSTQQNSNHVIIKP
ncbi:unnamed protein product, partial [Meganyctiphanes norvegica]